jgi:hypothetical protein
MRKSSRPRLLGLALTAALLAAGGGLVLQHTQATAFSDGIQKSHEIAMPRVSHWAEFSRVKTYSTTRELLRDSKLVIRGHATGYSTELVDGAPAYVTDFTVEDTLVAAPGISVHPGDTLKVRDVYGENGADGKEQPLYLHKTNWLLFLTPFYFTPGQSTGQWISTGGPAGIFMNRLPEGSSFTRVDPESDLPSTLGTADQEGFRRSPSVVGTGALA